MDRGELIELFYNRAYEKFVNKQILDDKNYIVPRQQLINYVHELIDIPYIDFIEYIKQNCPNGNVKPTDIIHFNSFDACEIEMCNALIWANNPGCQYMDIGRYFPNNIISKSDSSYRRYGESHVKASAQLGLTFEYYNYWYLSCLGYIFPNLNKDTRKKILARTITRNQLFQLALVDILDHDVNPEVYMEMLPEHMLRRCLRSTCYFLDICLSECKEQNIKTHQLIKSFETFKPPVAIQIPPDTNHHLHIYLTEFEFRNLSVETTSDLIKKFRNGDKKAYEILVKGYMRLVITIAKTYLHKGMELDVLIQEGTLGLIKAFKHYNVNVGVGFNKYASWWIMQSIAQAVVTLPYIVQIPQNTISLHRKAHRFIENFEQKHGYPPSVDEIDLSESFDLEWMNYIYQLPTNLREMTCLLDNFDIFESSAPPTDYFQEVEYNSYFINQRLRFLGNKNSTILRKHFGLEDNPEGETLNAIGDYFGLTRERTRQIVEKSIRELRDLSGIKREEAKIGDKIRLDSSEQVGKVMNIKQSQDGSVILVLKMDAGNTEEVSVCDSSYEILPKKIAKIKTTQSVPTPIVQAEKRILLEHSKKTQEESDIQHEVKKFNNIKVGDIVRYNGKECTIRKILCRGNSSKLLVEYTNGVLDYLPNDESKYRIIHTPEIPQYKASEERKNETKPQKSIEVSVGDRIIYDTKPCTILEKSKKHNVVRMKVKYDDDRIDNVLDDRNRYEILNPHGNLDNTELSQQDLQEWIANEDIVTNHEAEPASVRKRREELYDHYTQLIMKLNQAVVKGKRILAKPALLTAVIDAVNSREICQNRIILTASLEDNYNRILTKYSKKKPEDKSTSIAMPFWYLQSEKFWHLEPPCPNTKSFNPTKKWIIDNVKYARLDDELWYLIQNGTWRTKLREYIVEHKLLANSTPQYKNEELLEADKDEKRSLLQFATTTSLSKLVGLGIITKKQFKHCRKKGLSTIGDVKKIIEYYRLTPDSTRFTKYTLDMWFKIIHLLNSKE